MRRDTWQALRSRVVFVNAPLERSESDSSAKIEVSILRKISIGTVQIFQYRYLSKYRYFWQHYNEEWNVFSAFNPSKCTHTWTLWRPGSSWGFGALHKGLSRGRFLPEPGFEHTTLGLKPRVSSPTLYPLGHDCPQVHYLLGTERSVIVN